MTSDDFHKHLLGESSEEWADAASSFLKNKMAYEVQTYDREGQKIFSVSQGDKRALGKSYESRGHNVKWPKEALGDWQIRREVTDPTELTRAHERISHWETNRRKKRGLLSIFRKK